MKARTASQIRFRGAVESRHEANALLEQPGDSVAVIRGRPRSFVMACPDGCGSVLTVNLDPRVGKAWRLYDHGSKTLFPSVWRDSGCQSHFIIWRDRILWCGRDQDNYAHSPVLDSLVEEQVLRMLGSNPKSAQDIATELDAIPYDVEHLLGRFVKSGRAELITTRPARYRRAAEIAQSFDDPVGAKDAGEAGPFSKRKPWWRQLLGWWTS